MKRNSKMRTLLNSCILFTLVCLLIGLAGCSQVGRYQFVDRDSGKPYIVDTTTGKYWTLGDRGATSTKIEFVLPGKIGRYKGVYSQSNLYI